MIPKRRRARVGSPGRPASSTPPRFPGVAIYLAEPRMGRSRRAFLTRLAVSKGFRVLDAYRCAVVETLAAGGGALARRALRGGHPSGAPARGALPGGGGHLSRGPGPGRLEGVTCPGASARGAFMWGGRLHEGRGARAAPTVDRGTPVWVSPCRHAPMTLVRSVRA